MKFIGHPFQFKLCTSCILWISGDYSKARVLLNLEVLEHNCLQKFKVTRTYIHIVHVQHLCTDIRDTLIWVQPHACTCTYTMYMYTHVHVHVHICIQMYVSALGMELHVQTTL